MRRAALISTLALAACGKGPLPIDVSPPGSGRTLIVIAQWENQRRLVALSVGSNDGAAALPSIPDYDGSYPVNLTVLAYDQSAADLGVTTGVLREAAEGSPLPAGFRAFTREVRGDVTGDWTPLAELPAELVALRSPDIREAATACVRFTAKSFSLETKVDTRAAFAYGSSSALVFTTPNGASEPTRMYLVDANGARRMDPDVPNFTTQLGNKGVNVGFEASDGEIWFVTGGAGSGQLYHGTIATGFRAVADRPAVSKGYFLRWLGGSKRAGDPIYVLSDNGSFERWANNRWTILGKMSETSRTCVGGYDGYCSSISWLSDDDVLVIKPHGNGLMEWRNDTFAQLEAPIMETLVRMIEVEGLGRVLFTGRGSVLTRATDGSWQPLGMPFFGQALLSASPFRDGFLYSGLYGALRQYYPSSSYCTPIEGLFSLTVNNIVPFADGSGVVLTGRSGVAAPTTNQVVVLTPDD